jgi:hypothetical protein
MPGLGPAAEPLYVSAKVAKTIDAQSGHIERDERKEEGGPTRCAQTRPAE